MTKTSYPALIATLVVTGGLVLGGLWYLNRTSPGLVGGLTSPPGTGPQQPQTATQLSLVGDTFSGYSTFRSEAFQQALAEFGLGLSYTDEFDQAKRAADLSQGKTDLMVTTLDQFIKQKPQGKIVGLIDRTLGADAVVLNTKKYPNLKSLLDVEKLVQQTKAQGQLLKIVYAGDTPSEYLALVLDTKFDALNLADFEQVKVADASEAWSLMQDPAQAVAIAVLWEPYVTQARQQGYTVVLSSKDAPGAIVDVLVASDQVLQSRPDQVSELLEAYYRRIDSNVRDTSQLQAQIAEDGGLDPADASAVLQGIDFFTAAEAKTWMEDGTLKRRIEAIAAVLVLSGRIDQLPPNPDTLYRVDFLNKAAANTQALIDLVRADSPDLADKLAGKDQTQTATTPAQVTTQQVQTAPDIGNLQVQGKVDFATGSAQLTAAGQQTLNTLVQEIQEFNPQTVAVRVIGHTSQSGSAALNQTLSQQRAQVVVDYLRSKGIKHNIVAEGKGFSQPLANIPAADTRNQRTEIRLVRVN